MIDAAEEKKLMITEGGWTPFSWYCPNCGTIVTGYRSQNGFIKVVCGKCNTTMIRKIMSKKHDTIDVYASCNQAERRLIL